MYYLQKMVLIMPVVFLVFMLINRVYIKFNTKLDVECVIKGDKVYYEFDIKNNGFLMSGQIFTYVEVYYGEYLRHKFIVECSLMPFEKKKHSIEMVAEYAGCMTIVRKKVKMYDYFRLFSIPFGKKNVENNLLVIPKASIVDVEVSNATNMDLIEADKYHSSKKGSDRSEIFDVREYSQGDSMRDIHWKLSLKCDKYMIKEYSLPINTDIELVIDMCSDCKSIEDIEKNDKILEAVSSVAYALINKELPFYYNIASENNGLAEREFVEAEAELCELLSVTTQVYNTKDVSIRRNKAKKKFINKKKYDKQNEQYKEVLKDVQKKNVLLFTTSISENLLNEIVANHDNKKIVIIYVCDNKETEQFAELPINTTVIYMNSKTKGMGDAYEIRF